ncbi:MAG: FGGY-family carbohydrate kinase [Syntrophales bacterium]|jgi:sugar (pentulose or hexulose) kinase|nr:FGGY-family carbohydrate kinase [Syntrophales bacterium]MCK9527795.1 FGGY-family carbohydrate kinase [Syntrophales bacterium]MDX9922108.1 FGGY-family carbohydrate kinase [Syntrophales bacterium]
MNGKDLLLAIDNGTQSLKAILFDSSGGIAAMESVPFDPPYVSPQPAWAEQDPEVYWKALCRGCRGLWDKSGIDKNRVAAVSLTTQRGTVIPVDRRGMPLRPFIHWLDQRRTEQMRPVGGLWGLVFSIIGMSDTIAYFQSQAEANWIMTYQPDIWKRTHKYLLLSGYLTFRLTGTFVDSIGCQVGYIPFDYKNLRWAPSWDWKWRVLPMDPSLLPDLVPQSETLGIITREAAEATGIPGGIPLIAAAADKACEVIGCGSLEPSVGCLSYGTTATINVTNRNYMEAIPFLPAYPSAIPAHHTMEIQIYRGFWMVSWFKKEFGYPELAEAADMDVEAEVLLDRLVDHIPPGSMGLMLQPYWSPGLKLPGPEAKGAVIGFGDVHTRGHLYRAILEGLAYALREGKERIEKKTRIPITALRVSGGGSRSRNAMQTTADIFGLPTAKASIYETSGLGAAINAAVGIGIHRDFETAIREMTHTGEVYEPNLQNHRLYDQLYAQVYKKMYRQLRPFYRKIREITGYPG